MDTRNFNECFSNLLTECEQHLSGLDDFLAEQLSSSNIEDPQSAVKGIDAILDSIDRKYDDLADSKRNGSSRAAWLQQTLTRQTESLQDNQAAALIGTVTRSLNGDEVSANTVDENDSFSGLDAVEKVRNLDQALVATTCQAQTELQTALLNAPDEAIAESELMQRAIEGKDPVAFKQVRKIAAVCLLMMNTQDEPMSYVSASIMADRGVFAIQTDYAVGAGTVNEADAVEALIDRYTVQLCCWLEEQIPHLVDLGITAIASFAKVYLPTASPWIDRIALVSRFACKKAAVSVLHKGIEMLQSQVKGLWQRLKEHNSLLGKVANKVGSLLTAN